MKRIAVIVIGSNSTRSLIADDCAELTNTVRGRVESRLFLQLSGQGNISEASAEKLMEGIRQLMCQILSQKAQLLGIFATSAMRDAANKEIVSSRIQKLFGMPLTIISGPEEAAYSFYGAAGIHKAGMIDIGGGSTEIALGENGKITTALSLQLGASRLFQHNPIHTAQDVQKALDKAHSIAAPALKPIANAAQERGFLLVGGTGTSCARIVNRQDGAGDMIEGTVLTEERILRCLMDISATPREKRGQMDGFPAGREDILPTGLAILLAVMREIGISDIKVTQRGNTDGLLRACSQKICLNK